jgi:predicted nuclease of predicted toxin-antitoxin system
VKLLFDQMLASSLAARLADLFPDSEHVANLGLSRTSDTEVWQEAKLRGYAIVTKDKDFANLSLVWGPPPKVILLQLGNCSVWDIEDRLRRNAVRIAEFAAQATKGLQVITR